MPGEEEGRLSKASGVRWNNGYDDIQEYGVE
jgi:hypothetical protein